jgi:protein-disulfide isomerase
MRKAIDDALSIILTAAAVLIAAVVVWRQFIPATPAQGVTAGAGGPEFYVDWSTMLPSGIVIGDTAAPVKIVEFADLECPFCRQFHQATLPEVKEEFGARLALVLMHLPLAMHRFAKPAARAAECAEQQGRFAEIDSGLIIADRLGVRATPSVFVNGWRFPRPPTSRELSRVIGDLLAGREPFSQQP